MLEQSLANLEGVEHHSFAAEARGRVHGVPRELWNEVMLTDSTHSPSRPHGCSACSYSDARAAVMVPEIIHGGVHSFW